MYGSSTHFLYADLVERARRTVYRITSNGKQLLSQDPPCIDLKLLLHSGLCRMEESDASEIAAYRTPVLLPELFWWKSVVLSHAFLDRVRSLSGALPIIEGVKR